MIICPCYRGRIATRKSKILGSGGVYSAVAATFDGTNDYMTRGAGLTGAVDGKKGIFSCWVKISGGANNYRMILDTPSDKVIIYLTNANKFIVRALDPTAVTTLIQLTTINTYSVGAAWHHVLASWDLATAGARHLYITDVSDMSVDVFANNTIDYTVSEWAIGVYNDLSSYKWNGCLSELYFNTVDYLDFSVVANRRKFIDASGAPVSLGADGSTPTGTVPIIYLNNTYNFFDINRGSGGNFTITGALTECADPPP